MSDEMAQPQPPRPEVLLCPDCRYDLTSLPTGNCPECGKAFTPEQVRAYWIHRKTRSKSSRTFLALAAFTLVLGCGSFMIVPVALTVHSGLGIITLVFLIALWQCHRTGVIATATLFMWSVFLLATSTVVTHYAIETRDSLVAILSLMLLVILQCLALVFILRRSNGSLLLRAVYLVPLYFPALLFAHGYSRSTPADTWSDFNMTNQANALLGSQLMRVAIFAIVAHVMCVASFEHFLRRRKPGTISSSVHSPAAESVPRTSHQP